jgi:hypothetical protein
MSINREQRRKVANNLAALMRGEITDDEYLKRGAAIKKEIEKSDSPDKFAAYNADFGWTVCISEDGKPDSGKDNWSRMLCRLAFLESDLDLKPEDSTTRPNPRRWALLPLILLFAVVTASACWLHHSTYGWNWWMLITAWVTPGATAGLILAIRNSYDHLRKEKPAPSTDSFHPFSNEQQFKEHSHLLKRFTLPAPPPTRVTEDDSLGLLMGTCLVIYAFIMSLGLGVLLGPFLAFMTLPRYYERNYRYVAVKEGES